MRALTYRRGGQWIGLLCLLTSVGCAAAVPYRYGRFHSEVLPDVPADESKPSVEFGKPSATLDRVASLVGLPEKLLGLNKKIDNHAVSLDTVTKLRGYLNQNDLADVAIYVNCYDPMEQWRRLRENRQMGAGWRYTMGTVSVIQYTLFPSRIFGGDTYNPYTNSLCIDSDVPAIAILEAAYAKKIHEHSLPGSYVALTAVPGVALYRQCRAVGDVLGYARAQHDWETERQAYEVLYSQVGAETASIAGLATPIWWATPAFTAGGAAAGHATGRMIAAHRAKQIDATTTDQPEQLASEPDAAPNGAGAAPIDRIAAPPAGAEADRLAEN
jgi:hypothetical protein